MGLDGLLVVCKDHDEEVKPRQVLERVAFDEWEELNWEEMIIFHHVVRPPLVHDGWLYIVPPVSMRDCPLIQ